MNTAHWHLLLNHLPIVGTVIGTLIIAAGFILKNNPIIKQTGLGVLVFSALCAIPAYLTGEGAEEIAEKLPGVSEIIMEDHEDLGKLFLILSASLGLLALLTFISDRMKAKLASTMYVFVLMAGLGLSVVAKQVGTSGGEVRHTEIRSNAVSQPAENAGQGNEGQHDDD
jgi:uncharacterized membrane protein